MNAILYGVEEATLGASGRGPDKWTLVLSFGGELLKARAAGGDPMTDQGVRR